MLILRKKLRNAICAGEFCVKVTLYDIARKIGVSPSTVQRALNGADGVGEARREEIRRLAEAMGYRRNSAAFSLKTGTKTIAVVFPEPLHDNRYYCRYLWEGALGCAREHGGSAVALLERNHSWGPAKQAEAIRAVLAEEEGRIDGIVTLGTQAAVEAMAAHKPPDMPVAFVGADADVAGRLCCARTFDEMAGRMAADLLINFTEPRKRRKVVVTGDMLITDQFYNAQGFERHILENGFPLEVVKLANDPDLDMVKEGIKEVLDSSLDVIAVYATSARNTVPMCQAIAESRHGQRVRGIGNDIFPESIALARENRLNAIIHKRPSTQAYQAMQALMNHLIKGETPASDLILIEPVIVMKSNIERFL